MATILHITAHPHDHQTSYSMAVGKAFIDAYREANPNDEVIPIDLYKISVPHIDADVFSGWGKLRSGQEFDSLSKDEQAKVARLGELTDQFVAADKYVFVTPMWNFSFPPIMKAYLDSLCTAGKTFKYTESGPVGLLPDKRRCTSKPRGGVYSEGPGQILRWAIGILASLCPSLALRTSKEFSLRDTLSLLIKQSKLKKRRLLVRRN